MGKVTIRDLDLIGLYAAVARASYASHRTLHDSRRMARKRYSVNTRWDGQADSLGRVYPAVWPVIAEFMLERGFDPDACIAARFAEVCGTDKQVWPNTIAAEQYVDAYDSACDSKARSICAKLRLQSLTCRSDIIGLEVDGYSRREACELVLLDRQSPYSPLFRFCLARSEGLRDVWPSFVTGAVIQFLMSPEAHVQVWGDWLPEGFAAACEDARGLSLGAYNGRKQKARMSESNVSKGKSWQGRKRKI